MKAKKTLKIEIKIMILVVVLLILSILISAAIALSWFEQIFGGKIEDNILNIGFFIAADEEIGHALSEKDQDKVIQPIVKNYLDSIDDITFIVVADMDRVRYSHPFEDRIGKKIVGGDEDTIIQTGEPYISESVGTLGESLRAFVPINYKGEQVGFVVVGTLTKSLAVAKQEILNDAFMWILISLGIGVFGSFLIAKSIKKSLLGLEPKHIVKLFIEKARMLDAIHEGIISIDNEGKITLINESALNILGIKEIDLAHAKGAFVEDVFPTSRLTNVLKTQESEHDREQSINGRVVVTNRIPIINNGEVLGAIATFRDKTEIINIAEELIGAKQIVQALRSNSHEFLNKIHVIMGLVQIKEYDEVESYLKSVISYQQNMITNVVSSIKDPTIAGLLFGKISRASELGAVIVLDKRSKLNKFHGSIESATLIIIIGNLIENAFFALNDIKGGKHINLFIFEDQTSIFIEVEDRGIGIEKENLNKMFQNGYSTKPGSNGTGLYLVKNIVEESNGEIEVDSEIGVGTIFRITINKEVADNASINC